MNTKDTAHAIIKVTGVFASVILVLFLFKTTPLDICGKIDTNIFANYGSIVGGMSAALLSLASVLLIIHSINEQEKNRLLQNIESRFFELLRFSRENSENIQSKGNNGRAVFVNIKKDFNKLFSTIIHWYTHEKSGVSKEQWLQNLISITYLIIFFGVDSSQFEFLKEQIRKIITDESVRNNFELYVLNPLNTSHTSTKEENKSKEKNKRKYLEYDGYQNVLGHYFRNLFQTVNYINNQKVLTYRNKYDYIKILRAQLSSFEQVLFFYNSLSPFGLPWEKDPKIQEDNGRLITKYNLVTNITFKLNKLIDVRSFYPQVTFEGDNVSKERIELEKKYS